jgi:hypothetical protein
MKRKSSYEISNDIGVRTVKLSTSKSLTVKTTMVPNRKFSVTMVFDSIFTWLFNRGTLSNRLQRLIVNVNSLLWQSAFIVNTGIFYFICPWIQIWGHATWVRLCRIFSDLWRGTLCPDTNYGAIHFGVWPPHPLLHVLIVLRQITFMSMMCRSHVQQTDADSSVAGIKYDSHYNPVHVPMWWQTVLWK